MKHSKYRNTGLLFELLTRQITTDILNNESSSKASAILKKHFNKKSQLFKENQLFNVILESKFKDENKASHLVETTQKAYSRVINQKSIKLEKYNLIKSIKENFNLEDFFKSRVTNYRLLAAIHNVISENYDNPVATSKSHFTLLEYMTRKTETKESEILASLRKENKDLRHITYKILVEKFNNKYKSLTKEQKDVLREYINNISNSSGLADFLESRFKDISFNLKKQLPKIDDKVIKIKIKECINLVSKTKINNAESTNNVLKLMRFYQLLEDVKNATR
tara:strand:+ start:6786 stop:7625 length:840 start_codon:yes stop_codon:yes gene_type:complete